MRIREATWGCVAAFTLLTVGTAAYAQAPAPANDRATTGSMTPGKDKMSVEDKAVWKKCKAMPAEARAADMACKSFMSAHPDAVWTDKGAAPDKPK